MKNAVWAVLVALTGLPLLGAAQAAQAAEGRVDPKVVYGDDDRRDLYQVEDAKVLALADSTVALFKSGDVSVKDTVASLNVRAYGEGYMLCKEEPFFDQSNGAFCSGSLVGPDLLMTAGHCLVSEEACKDTKFVFGFGIKDKGQGTPKSVAASEVYGCGKLLGREQVGNGADWALVQLDRPVSGHAALSLGKDPAKDDPILVIGHPAGLPTKVAGGAKVRDASPNGYFVANLDTYGGNSGSAVFSAITGKVIGILVRGETDYTWKGDCRITNACASDACRGEDVTKIGSVGFPKPVETAGAARVAPLGGPAFRSLLEHAATLSQQ